MRDYIQEGDGAQRRAGRRSSVSPGVRRRPIPVPADFTAAVKKNKKALAAFEAFSPSHRREYLEWITEAKSEDTRKRRIAQAIEWMAQGKSRNWKIRAAEAREGTSTRQLNGQLPAPHQHRTPSDTDPGDRVAVCLDGDVDRLGRRIATPCRLTNAAAWSF